VLDMLGEPDARASTSRKHREPSISKYGDIELHFGPDGALVLIHAEPDGPLRGGRGLDVDPWVISGALSLEEFRRQALLAGVSFGERVYPYAEATIEVVTSGDVRLLFRSEDDNTTRLVAVSRRYA
jgi:hypothetical protein